MVQFKEDALKKQFDYFFKSMVQYLIENPLYFHFMDQFHNSPIITATTKEEGIRSFSPLILLLQKGQEQGIVKSISIDELMQFLNGGLTGFVRWILSNEKQLTPTLLDNQLRIAWDAIKQ
jgi:TetR/AcrR family transcriptional regulator, repressor of fatR-cypB operon